MNNEITIIEFPNLHTFLQIRQYMNVMPSHTSAIVVRVLCCWRVTLQSVAPYHKKILMLQIQIFTIVTQSL